MESDTIGLVVAAGPNVVILVLPLIMLLFNDVAVDIFNSSSNLSNAVWNKNCYVILPELVKPLELYEEYYLMS